MKQQKVNSGKTNNGRKKKEAKTRYIHELRGSVFSSSSSNINDSNSNVASSINPPLASTTAPSTAVSYNANNTVPSEPITLLEAANAN